MSFVTYKDVINEAGKLFAVHPRDLQGKIRYRFLMPARFAVWKALSTGGTSYSQIGRWFERDHTTIIHGVNRATALMQEDKAYHDKVAALTELWRKK